MYDISPEELKDYKAYTIVDIRDSMSMDICRMRFPYHRQSFPRILMSGKMQARY